MNFHCIFYYMDLKKGCSSISLAVILLLGLYTKIFLKRSAKSFIIKGNIFLHATPSTFPNLLRNFIS